MQKSTTRRRRQDSREEDLVFKSKGHERRASEETVRVSVSARRMKRDLWERLIKRDFLAFESKKRVVGFQLGESQRADEWKTSRAGKQGRFEEGGRVLQGETTTILNRFKGEGSE